MESENKALMILFFIGMTILLLIVTDAADFLDECNFWLLIFPGVGAIISILDS